MASGRRDWWRTVSVIRWQIPSRTLVAVTAALALMLVVAILVEARSASTRDLPAPAVAAAPQPLGNGQFRFFPASAHINLGVPYRFALNTHCGLDFPVAVDFDQSFWDPIGPGPASDGHGNPPPGFANPIDHGSMTLISPTRARFRSSGGAVIQFNRHAGARVSSACS